MARLLQSQAWATAQFAGVRLLIEAGTARSAEALARTHGHIADLEESSPGTFEALIVHDKEA